MKIQTHMLKNILQDLNSEAIINFIIASILFAQLPLSFLAFEGNIPNRHLILPFRGIILLGSLFLLIYRARPKINSWTIICSIFWLTYLARLFIDIFIFNVSTAIPTWEIIAWSIGVSFLPSLAINSAISQSYNKSYLKALPLIIFGVLALGFSLTIFLIHFNPLYSRFLLPDLNPIPAGHAGASLFIISFSHLVSQRKGDIRTLNYSLTYVGVALGIIITLASSTRSAFISIIIGLFFIAFTQHKTSSIRSRLIYIATTISIAIASYLTFGESGLIEKLRTFGHGASELNRITFIRSGLDYWLEKPIMGQGFRMHELLGNLFSELDHFYPHNFIIESMLLGGILMAGLLIMLMILTTQKSIDLIKLYPNDAWMVCLWIQSFIYVMVSGHLGNVPIFWCSSAIICGRHQSLIERNI